MGRGGGEAQKEEILMNKVFERMVRAEHKEHPWTTMKQARRIAMDHIREGKKQ
jgi:hypothetical protein